MSPENETSSPEFAANGKKLRACSNCARLKIRCRWPPATRNGESNACTRCSRQAIRCQVPEQVPRKKRGKSSRVTELEKKIDGLVNLFQSQQQSRHPASPTLTPETIASRNEEQQIRQILPCAGIYVPPLDSEANLQSNTTSPNPDCNAFSSPDGGPSAGALQLVPGLSVSIQEAEEYLDIYRTRMVPHFPFVPVSPKTTAFELHKEKRFLFWCIIQSVAPQSAAVQKLVDDWIRQHAAVHIIVNKEKKLEYLQGLLLYFACQAWGDINIQAGMSANGLLSLVIGLVSDMSFNKFIGPLSWMPKNMRSDAFSVITKGKTFEPPKPSLEEQRAVVGGYFVASSVGLSMRRSPQIHYTSHIAQCCRNIREAKELASDDNLLALVRMQRVADRLRTVFPVFEREEEDPVPVFREHYGVIMSSLRKEVDSLPSEEIAIAKQNPFIWSQYTTLVVRIYEPALAMRAVSPSETNFTTESYSRSEALWTCLQSIQDAMDALSAIPVESYAYLPFVLVSNTAFVILAATRVLLEDGAHDWDVALARRKIDHAENMRRLMENFEKADNVALIVGQKRRLFEDNTSRWSNYAYRARWMRQWYLSKVAPVTRDLPMEQPTSIAGGMVSDENVAWPVDLSMEQLFWEQMMVNGLSSYNFDNHFISDMMPPPDEMIPITNLIPQ